MSRGLIGATPQAGEGVAPLDRRQFNSGRAQGPSLMRQGPGAAVLPTQSQFVLSPIEKTDHSLCPS